MENRSNAVYKANLQRTGALVSESIALLTEYHRQRDWEAVRQAALQANLLQKGSSETVARILLAVKRWFWQAHDSLPPVDSLAAAVAGGWPETAKVQVLLPYSCAADLLLDAAIRHVVAPRLAVSNHAQLTFDAFTDFLAAETATHPELAEWSDSVRHRWFSSFRSLLRAYGFMEPHPSLRLLRPVVRVEAFAFHAMGLKKAGVPTIELLADPCWELYALREMDKENLLVEGQARGWWDYARAGDVVQLQMRYDTVEGWLDGTLG